MKKFLLLFFLTPLFLFSQERNTGFFASAGGLARADNTLNFQYEVGIYTHLSKRHIFVSYGVERYSFAKIGGGGNINNNIKADFAFIFYTNAGFYGDKVRLPQHFGGLTSFYLRKAFTPYLRITLTTLDPAIEVGLRYEIGFID